MAAARPLPMPSPAAPPPVTIATLPSRPESASVRLSAITNLIAWAPSLARLRAEVTCEIPQASPCGGSHGAICPSPADRPDLSIGSIAERMEKLFHDRQPVPASTAPHWGLLLLLAVLWG